MESSSSISNNQNEKKDPFEQLSKEELIEKCKQFLSIAQKAKRAKDEINEENKAITKKFEELENKSQNDIKAMQEMLSVLTQQKLQLVTENDTLVKQKLTSKNEIKNYQQELQEVKTKIQNIDTENQHYSRQVKRLTDENEQLLSHLDTLEKRINELNKIGEEQRVQLLSLEKQNIVKEEKQVNDNFEENQQIADNKILLDLEEQKNVCKNYEIELENLKFLLLEKDTKIEHLCKEVDNLTKNNQINQSKNCCQLKSSKINELEIKIDELNVDISTKNNAITEFTKTIDDLNKELENTKSTKEHYNDKLKSYHSKLIKVFSDIKYLKQNKNELLIVIDDYSKYVHKWQNEIKVVSERFKEEIDKRDFEIENHVRKNDFLQLKINNLEDELKHLKTNPDEQTSIINDLKSELTLKEIDVSKLMTEKSDLLDIIEKNQQEMETISCKNNELKSKMELQDKELNSIRTENDTLLNTVSNLEIMMKRSKQDTEKQDERYMLLLLNNDELSDRITSVLKELKQVKKDKDDLEKCIHKYINKLKQNTETIETLTNENESLLETMKNNNEVSIEKDNIEKKFQKLKDKFKIEKNNNNVLENKNSYLLREIDSKNEKLKEMNLLQKLKDELETENNNLTISLKESENQISEFKKIVNDFRDQLKNNSTSNDELIKTLSKENTGLTEKLKIINDIIIKYENVLSSYKIDLSELQNQLALSKRENVELLKEMNEMNQVIKERGETISKQQEYNQELNKKIKGLEEEAVNYNQQILQLQEEIKNLNTETTKPEFLDTKNRDILLEEKNDKIKTLEQEILQLKESFNSSLQDGGCSESETMSTSTISRMDEAARLRDLEGSWEERYSKLRTLALKLKGKVKEQNEQLTQERTEKSELHNKLTTLTRNLQSVQMEYDKIQDEYEITDKENKKKLKHIESLTSDNDKLKRDLAVNSESVSKLQLELDSLRKEKMGSSTAAKQYINQIQNLKKEIDDKTITIKELENKIMKLEKSISFKEEDYQTEIKAHNATKEKLQKIEKEIKKNSVLSLEMEDYERSLNDLSQKLEVKNSTISNLEEKIKTQEVSISALKDQVKMFEEKISEEETHCLNLKKQLLESQTKISTIEVTVAQKENRIREIMKTLEDNKIKSEEENSELTRVLSQTQKQLEQLQTERDHLKSLILGLEEKTKELTKILSNRELEVSHLQTEFTTYKVRAQSVLRQNQTRDIISEERLIEEVNELKLQNESLLVQLENISSKLKTVSDQYEQISNEKSETIVQCQELEKLLAKTKDDNKNLLARQQQLITEHKEAIRAQKIHSDTLVQCYKQQLAEQEERHIKELTELKIAQTNIQALNKPQEEIDVASMPREDAEGSESIDSTNNQFSKLASFSLDKLLNSDIENNLTLDYEAELNQCKKRLEEYTAKITHLTDLLADTEQDLAKHAQLNQHLKEEIRRHQRSVEREKHAENLEYLKNVVFKFLTLNNGDEKSHLVPVLNTILKLSPEETQKLNAVAKGTDMSARGWGSYLPLWSGSNNHL